MPTSALPSAVSLFSTPVAAAPSATTVPVDVDQPQIVIRADGAARPFDRRLLGTNVPAWLAETLKRPEVQARTIALGTTLLRLPGGSWSNSYDWLACETGDTEACYWPWAARPTDLLNFVRATGQEAMWTVSFNGTAKEAAALVAFFNGTVDDTTPIGVDIRGRDWKTVGDWARLRAEHGNPEPLPIRYWEVGNEVYGGKEANGSECAAWGWEDVWTCDGAEYVNGRPNAAEPREGYLEFRSAMRAVDATILVGAVGVSDPAGWSNWGNEVIEIAGEELDFYSVHYYAYDQQPSNSEDILQRPTKIWSRIMGDLNAAFDRYADGRRPPVAVTEYNLVAFQELDNDQLMRRAANGLFIADMIGQMAEQGVAMANQWDLANGRADNGTDYGLLDAESAARSPQYYAVALWGRFGDELLPVESTLPADTTLGVYAGRDANGDLLLLAINKTGEPLSLPISVVGVTGQLQAQADVVSADSLDATTVLFNGVAEPADDLSDAPAQTLEPFEGQFEYTFAPFSITLLRLARAE